MQDIVALDIVALFVIILISYIIMSYLFDDTKEHYVTSIVGYNNTKIPAYSISSKFDLETSELVKVFKDKFSDDKVDSLGFKEHNPYIPFPFEASIKKLIIDYMKTNIERFKGHKMQITSDLNKLYYKDSDNDRIFIFNISLVNNTRFMTRNLRIKLKIKNINNFIKDIKTEPSEIEPSKLEQNNIEPSKIEQNNIEYRTDIPSQTIINASEILSIRLDKNNYARFELQGFDSLNPYYYQIRNILGLTEPFVTSGRDMIITDKMKKDFVKKIEESQELLTGKKNT